MIIGVCGEAGSGKDTVSDILVKNHSFVKIALADELKRICMRVYDFSYEQLWGPSKARNEPDTRYPRVKPFKDHPFMDLQTVADIIGPSTATHLTPRYALQMLGTEWGRNCYEDTWIDLVIRQYGRLQAGGCYYDQVLGMQTLSYAGGADSPIRAKTNVVVSDVRWPAGNEGTRIRAAGGKLWRTRRGTGLEGAAGQHVSETEMNQPDSFYDHVFYNNGPLEDLPGLVAEAMK